MDCCLCGTLGNTFRPPRNTICSHCYEGARSILHLSSKIEQEWRLCPESDKSTSPKGLLQAYKHFEHLERMEEEASEKLEFLESLADAFKEGMHTDVEMVTEDGGSVCAHRVVLATKSPVFKAMFETDQCKEVHSGSIFIPEMTQDQLRQLLGFLYSAEIPETAMAENAGALLVAADKYDIPVLSKICEAHLAGTVKVSNVLEMLELATLCSATGLKQAALGVVIKNFEDVVFSKEYEEFALKNAIVAVEITKALIRDFRK